MCGIGAFQLINGEANGKSVAQALLRSLVSRGRDASGCAWHDNNTGETFIQKLNMAGDKFATELDDEVGSVGIVHTRWATQGDPRNNNNNHPIDVRGLVGVHNGHISNDKQLLADLPDYERFGSVDSEAAFAHIAHGDKQRKMVQRLGDIRGTAALLWLRSNDKRKRLYAARVTSSPLWIAQTDAGSVVLASTPATLEFVHKQTKLPFTFLYEMKEKEFMIIENGVITEMATIPNNGFGLQPTKTDMPSYSQTSMFETK